jgi:hypothetical protein
MPASRLFGLLSNLGFVLVEELKESLKRLRFVPFEVQNYATPTMFRILVIPLLDPFLKALQKGIPNISLFRIEISIKERA